MVLFPEGGSTRETPSGAPVLVFHSTLGVPCSRFTLSGRILPWGTLKLQIHIWLLISFQGCCRSLFASPWEQSRKIPRFWLQLNLPLLRLRKCMLNLVSLSAVRVWKRVSSLSKDNSGHLPLLQGGIIIPDFTGFLSSPQCRDNSRGKGGRGSHLREFTLPGHLPSPRQSSSWYRWSGNLWIGLCREKKVMSRLYALPQTKMDGLLHLPKVDSLVSGHKACYYPHGGWCCCPGSAGLENQSSLEDHFFCYHAWVAGLNL